MTLSKRDITLLLHAIDMAIGDFQAQLGDQRQSKVWKLCEMQIKEYCKLRERLVENYELQMLDKTVESG